MLLISELFLVLLALPIVLCAPHNLRSESSELIERQHIANPTFPFPRDTPTKVTIEPPSRRRSNHKRSDTPAPNSPLTYPQQKPDPVPNPVNPGWYPGGDPDHHTDIEVPEWLINGIAGGMAAVGGVIQTIRKLTPSFEGVPSLGGFVGASNPNSNADATPPIVEASNSMGSTPPIVDASNPTENTAGSEQNT